jgi:hypothetical protein
MGLFTTIAGGLLGGLGERERQEGIQAAAKETAANERAKEERGYNALTGTVGPVRTDRTPEGGFNVGYLPGTSGAERTGGDLEAAIRSRELGKNFKFPHTRPEVKNLFAQRDQLNERRFRTGLQDIVTAQNRNIGVNNSGFGPSTVDKIAAFTDANRSQTPIEVEDFLSKSRSGAVDLLRNQLAANIDQANTLTGPGGQAIQAALQRPSPTPPDLGTASLFGGGANIFAQLGMEEAAREGREGRDRLLKEILRGLGNQSAFS